MNTTVKKKQPIRRFAAAATASGMSRRLKTMTAMLAAATLTLMGVTDVSAVSADGGNIVTNYSLGSTNYTAHIFTNSGTLTVSSGGSVEVLVVGGGGGGGGFGGGGAGGFVYTSSIAVAGTNNVAVGGGGSGAGAGSAQGVNGGASFFSNLVVNLAAAGGGGGGAFSTANALGKDGGSGGGGGTDSVNPYTGRAGGFGNIPATTPPQGTNGGAGVTGATAGGGGGGAGSRGANATAGVGGKGGDGLTNGISGSSVAYCGGGGGGANVTRGAGGSGGGGVGGLYNGTGASNAVANTGGGGGGGYANTGGKGGSGIVIVRYIVVAAGAPVIANAVGGATNVQATSACLNGALYANGGYDTAVWVYYGTNNGGTTASAWQMNAFVATNLAAAPNPQDYSYPAAGLTTDTHYFYTFWASNSVDTAWASGAKEFDTKITDAPTILSATALDFGSIALTWSGTFATETGFVINYTNAVVNVTVMAGANATNYTVTGLSPVTTCGFRLAATNAAGLGPWSGWTQATTLAGAPVITNAAVGATNVQVTTAYLNGTLTTNGVADTAVWVYYGTNNGGTTASAWQTGALVATNLAAGPTPQNYSYPAADLTADTHYFYTFYASNSVTNAWATGAKAFDTKISAAPTILSATALDDESVALTWSGTFATETGFVINYSNAVVNVTVMAGANATNYTVTGLSPVTTCGFRLAATNAAGLGPWSDWTQATTLPATEKFATWGRKMKVTFTGYNKPATLTNFPALVVLSTNISGFSYGDFKSLTNQDLRFAATNWARELNYEIEKWDTNGSSYVWVQVPKLANSNDYIWAYWGKSGQTAPAYTTNGMVWANGYSGVYHLPDGSTLSANDSAANQKNGTKMNSPAAIAGRVGGGAGFASVSSQYVTMSNNLDIAAQDFTLAFWFNAANTNQFASIVGKNDINGPYKQYVAGVGYTDVSGNGVASKNIFFLGLSSWRSCHTSGNFADGTWHHVEIAGRNGISLLIYVDGVSVSTVTDKGSETDVYNYANPGNFNIGYNNASTYFNGSVDEVRVSIGTARSANWIWAEWMNSASNGVFTGSFNQYGTVTTPQPKGTLIMIF